MPSETAMSNLTDTKKRLALSIIDYLIQSTKDGTLSPDETENIEVATSCIAEAFKVDHSDSAAVKEAVGSQSLLNVFTVYEKMSGKGVPESAASNPAQPSTQPSQPSPE